MKDFARIIAEQRRKKEMTQEELARCLGITPQAVSKWENSVGLPDVALFPAIAEVLGLSIEELFGRPRPETRPEVMPTSFPQSFEGLPMVIERNGLICYSNKKMKEATDSELTFEDGSIAELPGGRIVNRGRGEIRVLRSTDCSYEALGGETVTRYKDFSTFSSLSVSLSHCCELKVHVDTQGAPRMRAKGRERLLDHLEARVENGKLTLRLDVPGQNNSSPRDTACEIDLFVPFACGESLDLGIGGFGTVTLAPSFSSGEIRIAGCGTVKAQNFDYFTGRIAGSGDLVLGRVERQTKLRISGSGDVKAELAADPDIRVSGSGDVVLKRSTGQAKISIAGSGDVLLGDARLQSAEATVTGCGDVSMRGEVDFLQMKVTGSGSLAGEELTVERADLNIKGAGEIALGRIVSESVEQLSRDATLRVSQRG